MTLGYVVYDRDSHAPMHEDRKGILYVSWGGRPRATVFPTRDEARAAIQRTRDYAEANSYEWGDDYHVFRLVPRTFDS